MPRRLARHLPYHCTGDFKPLDFTRRLHAGLTYKHRKHDRRESDPAGIHMCYPGLTLGIQRNLAPCEAFGMHNYHKQVVRCSVVLYNTQFSFNNTVLSVQNQNLTDSKCKIILTSCTACVSLHSTDNPQSPCQSQSTITLVQNFAL